MNNMELEKKETNVNPELLITQAINKGLPVETMEKLLAMRRELKQEWAKEQYFLSLSKFQKECPIIEKTKIVYNRDGKTVRYKYAPLEKIIDQVKDLLFECGFSYDLNSRQENNKYIAVCNIHHKDGHSEISEFILPFDDNSGMNLIHKVGSTRTYANRYCFCNAFGIMTEDEDNDGNIDNDIQSDIPECPLCSDNLRVIKSKYPGKEWYCLKCKAGFDLVNIIDEKENNENLPESQKMKKEIIDIAKRYTNYLNPDQLKHFTILNKSKDEYTENQYKLDKELLDQIEDEIVKVH